SAVEDRYAKQLDPADMQQPIGELMRALAARAPRVAPAPQDAPFEIAWDLRERSPALERHLSAVAPWLLPWRTRLSADVPVPPTNNSFDSGELFRPPGHFRAFYVRGPSDAVVALKGADVRCEDQAGFLQLLHQRTFERFAKFSVTNALEYFL